MHTFSFVHTHVAFFYRVVQSSNFGCYFDFVDNLDGIAI